MFAQITCDCRSWCLTFFEEEGKDTDIRPQYFMRKKEAVRTADRLLIQRKITHYDVFKMNGGHHRRVQRNSTGETKKFDPNEFTVIWCLDGDFMWTKVLLEPSEMNSRDLIVSKAISAEFKDNDAAISHARRAAFDPSYSQYTGYELIGGFSGLNLKLLRPEHQ